MYGCRQPFYNDYFGLTFICHFLTQLERDEWDGKRKMMKRDRHMATTTASMTTTICRSVSFFSRMHFKPKARQRNVSIFESQQRLLVFRACEVTLVIHTSHEFVPRINICCCIHFVWYDKTNQHGFNTQFRSHTHCLTRASFSFLCFGYVCMRKFKNKLLASVSRMSVYLNDSKFKFYHAYTSINPFYFQQMEHARRHNFMLSNFLLVGE